MPTGISAFGDRGLAASFGNENNEVHRKVWLNDPANQLQALLQKLFGTGPTFEPHRFPGDTIKQFFAYRVDFQSKENGVQGDSEAFGDFSILDSFPAIRGGIDVDITYRPMDESGMRPVTEEAWDFSAQTMSLIGNNYGQNPSSLSWSDGTAITNLSAIVKIIPKIELMQKFVYGASTPNATLQGLIGSVNQDKLFCGASDNNDTPGNFPAECVLLTGMPVIRRWRFDGQVTFEVALKFAINPYEDFCYDLGTVAPVTWNRLYRPGLGWDTVYVGDPADEVLL